jgi:pyruvate formate-lyase/glycerol dehydratase family glycyl radical enzyme
MKDHPDQSTERIYSLKKKTLAAERLLSVEQAKIVTSVYKENDELPVILKRALSLSETLKNITIVIDPEELIVGNRTPGIRSGVVFPEAGISWLAKELDHLPSRPQDPFNVKKEDADYFTEVIEPFWHGKTLEDDILSSFGDDIHALEKVVKINQKDHAQGHICPKVEDWLKYGPAGLLGPAREKLMNSSGDKKLFYGSVCMVLDSSCKFIRRYATLAQTMADDPLNRENKENLNEISKTCRNISEKPPSDFREALQSVWFLFVNLHMESNASSFSPGRLDQYLYSYYINDLRTGRRSESDMQELMDVLFIKFNHIVYMRNSNSARYFAGFPTGFNITIGGQDDSGIDVTNELSYLILRSQEHVRLPQPNLTARLHKNSPERFISECARIIGTGTGMPQIVNDESIIPALIKSGFSIKDAMDYVLVGCVELSTQGNYLGWSDAAMFNMVKVLELTLNNGKCMLSGKQLGPETGDIPSFPEFCDLENEEMHRKHLPSPLLSGVVDDCLANGKDVTTGGARYNLSGIQAIQVANIADSMAVLKKLVYDDKAVSGRSLYEALIADFKGFEPLRQRCINFVPKYGNDISWVDDLGARWVRYFAEELKKYKNYRGGDYQMGLYTVSAHVPMGQNVAATPDGRVASSPLADGGLSPMSGRDKHGPTAVLNSVARIPSDIAANGTLLNMKFLPDMFKNENNREKFISLLKSFIKLPIHHVQFNVVTTEDLIKAKADPDSYRGLTIRVAGYTAFFTELTDNLQDEIINRTSYDTV